jgi:hypothetical protein
MVDAISAAATLTAPVAEKGSSSTPHPLFTVHSSLGPVHPSQFPIHRTLFSGPGPRWLLWFVVAHVVELALRARNRFTLMGSGAHSQLTSNDMKSDLGLSPLTTDHLPLITAFSSRKALTLAALAYGVGLAIGLAVRGQLV